MIGIFAVAVLAVQATVVLTGARYPSGLDPALCPNYPHCDNVLLAKYAQPAGPHHAAAAADRYEDDGHYQYDHHSSSDGYQRHPSAYNAYPHHQPAVPSPYTEPGYPAGLTSSNCPNYPYCSHQVPAEALRYSQDRRYPSGVSPHNCPNYPYCH